MGEATVRRKRRLLDSYKWFFLKAKFCTKRQIVVEILSQWPGFGFATRTSAFRADTPDSFLNSFVVFSKKVKCCFRPAVASRLL